MISRGTLLKLQELGILGNDGEIKPDAYQGLIANKPVVTQAKILGIPVIHRPFRADGTSPEEQFVTYFRKRTTATFEGGESWATEGFIIKSLISSIIPGFDYRKKKVDLSKSEIEYRLEMVAELDAWDVAIAQEPKFDNIEISYDFGPKPNGVFSPSTLRERFRKSRVYGSYSSTGLDKEVVEEAKSKEKESNYVRLLSEYVCLWESMNQGDWQKIIGLVLREWSRIYAGWPDITIFSKATGLTLVEIKGKDKVHPNQVYTLMKLKDILGSSRMAIGLINTPQFDFSSDIRKAHTESVVEWLNTPFEQRQKLAFIHK